MNTQPPPFDDQTMLVSRDTGADPVALTEQAAPIQYEQLADRMVYAARQRPEMTLNISANPIVQAASGLLVRISILRLQGASDMSGALREGLVNDIKQFEFQALSLGSDSSDVTAARYLLCTALDEAITSGPAQQPEEQFNHSLLSAFHNETDGGEKVFQLIERITANPARYLDLMELAYLVLSLGFEGKYRFQSRGVIELEAIRDSLFRQVRTLRGDVRKELSPNWEGSKERPHKMTHHAPLAIVSLLAVLSLGVIFGGFSYVLDTRSASVSALYQTDHSPVVMPVESGDGQP